jgi:superfamily II DNA/RNA helicase
MAGRDLCGIAQTGTGKTLPCAADPPPASTTPAPERNRGPRVLILSPTRELPVRSRKASAIMAPACL